MLNNSLNMITLEFNSNCWIKRAQRVKEEPTHTFPIITAAKVFIRSGICDLVEQCHDTSAYIWDEIATFTLDTDEVRRKMIIIMEFFVADEYGLLNLNQNQTQK